MPSTAPVPSALASGAVAPDGYVPATVPIESEQHACQQFLCLGDDLEVLASPAVGARMAGLAADLVALSGTSP